MCWFVAAAKKKKKKNKTPAATHEASLPDVNTNDLSTLPAAAAAAVVNDISSKYRHRSMKICGVVLMETFSYIFIFFCILLATAT